ncbi:MAG: hypothetical protein M1826_001619 [Phylliscum demangeonii]|nr:MAG: hypothetical protein M1826_001619 [Phylliscum demangeonii]
MSSADSLTALSESTYPRAPSAVQGKVAQFNSLAKDAGERRRLNDAALQRAVIGREEAETNARKAREDARMARTEMQHLSSALEESKWREARVKERLDRVMEDYLVAKEAQKSFEQTQANSKSVYEKEVRRWRKETFKVNQHTIKLQSELQSARNSVKVLQASMSEEKAKMADQEREAFTARYQLVSVQEELTKMREMVKLVEEERDAVMASLQEEQVARMAAESGAVIDSADDGEDGVLGSPLIRKSIDAKLAAAIRRNPEGRRMSVEEAIAAESDALKVANRNICDLQTELNNTRVEATAREDGMKSLTHRARTQAQLRQQAEEQLADSEVELGWTEDEVERLRSLVDFMKLQCHFRRCGCRVAEEQGAEYTGARPALVANADHIFRKMEGASMETILDGGTGVTSPDENAAVTSTEPTEPTTPRGKEQGIGLTIGRASPPPSRREQLSPDERHACEYFGVDDDPDDHHHHLRTITQTEPFPQFCPREAAQAYVAHRKGEIILLALSVPRQLASREPDRQRPVPRPGLSPKALSPPPSPPPPSRATPAVRSPALRTITMTTRVPLASEDAGRRRNADQRRNKNRSPAPSGIKASDRTKNKRTITATAVVVDAAPPPHLALAMTMTREEALEQIRLRRGRAKSMAIGALTPRRQMLEGVDPRRDISAPGAILADENVANG